MTSVKSLLENPVLRREMDERMRTRRGAIAITVWLLLLSGIFLLVYQANSAFAGFDFAVTIDVGRIGREIFEWILFGMLVLTLFLVPAFTSGAIAGERERQTLVPLQMTSLSAFSIVWGKIAAALVFVMLLILLTAPLLAMSYLVGGVTVWDIVKGLAMVMLTAVMTGSLGVALSSKAKRVQSATVMAYGVVLLLSIGTFIALGALAIVDETRGNDEVSVPKEILALNPFAATADVFDAGGSPLGFGDTATPFGVLRSLLDELDRSRWDNVIVPALAEDPRRSTSLWRWYVVGAIAVTYLSVAYATGRVRAPAVSER